jgi:hypothetical protein
MNNRKPVGLSKLLFQLYKKIITVIYVLNALVDLKHPIYEAETCLTFLIANFH